MMQETFANQTLEMAHQLKIIETKLQKPLTPDSFCKLLKSFLMTITAKDPNLFHYEIIRRSLKHIDEEALKNEYAVDRLAREFVKTCNKLNENLKLPSTPEQFFNGYLSIWDEAYLKILGLTGSTGKKHAKELKKKLKISTWETHFWFRDLEGDSEVHFFHSPAFLGLAAALWKDIVEKRVRFADKNVPSLSTNIHWQVRKVLCPRNDIIANEKQIQLVHGAELLGVIDIPAIHAQIMPFAFRGIPKLNSVYGHKLFRFEVQEPFRKMAKGEKDYRVIELKGGRSELTEILGFRGKKAVTIIGEILHAQACLDFKGKNISGNLIQLTKFMSPITKRDEGLLITVGTMLLPYHTYEAYRKGECGLLIPLLKDPPLVGTNRYHAALYSLQMDVMAEFSKQSMELYNHGCITISRALWEELCLKNAIPFSMAKQVLDCWTQDGDNHSQFLQTVANEKYTLGSGYSKELTFLKDQGKRRVRSSLAGMISCQLRKGLLFKSSKTKHPS